VIRAVPDVLPRDYNATFQQAQFFTNDPSVTRLLKPAQGNTLERLCALSDPLVCVKESFLAVYGRLPDAEETAQAVAFLSGRAQNPEKHDAAVRDLVWALLSSAEFLTMP
jgi:hypothetical protein